MEEEQSERSQMREETKKDCEVTEILNEILDEVEKRGIESKEQAFGKVGEPEEVTAGQGERTGE